MSVDNVANVLHEVKEYAARANEINVDTFQMKLMHLDEMGRRFDHGDKELYSMVLQRFLCNKDQPRIGHLVTSLLCSPAEAKVYEKEKKILKLHGNKGIDTKPSNSNMATKIERSPSFDQFATMLQFMQNFASSHQQPMRFSRPPIPSFLQQRRGVTPNVRPRPGPNLQILYNSPLSPFPWEFHKFSPSEVGKRIHIPVLVSLINDATSLENDEKLDCDFNFELDNAHELLSEALYVYNQDHFL